MKTWKTKLPNWNRQWCSWGQWNCSWTTRWIATALFSRKSRDLIRFYGPNCRKLKTGKAEVQNKKCKSCNSDNWNKKSWNWKTSARFCLRKSSDWIWSSTQSKMKPKSGETKLWDWSSYSARKECGKKDTETWRTDSTLPTSKLKTGKTNTSSWSKSLFNIRHKNRS